MRANTRKDSNQSCAGVRELEISAVRGSSVQEDTRSVRWCRRPTGCGLWTCGPRTRSIGQGPSHKVSFVQAAHQPKLVITAVDCVVTSPTSPSNINNIITGPD